MSPFATILPGLIFTGIAALSVLWRDGQFSTQLNFDSPIILAHLAIVLLLSIAHGIFVYLLRRQMAGLITSRDNNQKLALQKTNILREEVRQHKAARNELQRLATHDQLTGARNRRHFRDTLASEMERYKRYHHDFSLLILDLDNFKKINDLYGHDSGDFVLQKFAQYIQQNLRQSDVFVRYGGQEFAIIATSTEVDSATRFAQKLCQNIETQRILHETHSIYITVSIGVGSPSLVDNATAQNLINATEAALRKAKSQGRNQAVCITEAN